MVKTPRTSYSQFDELSAGLNQDLIMYFRMIHDEVQLIVDRIEDGLSKDELDTEIKNLLGD